MQRRILSAAIFTVLLFSVFTWSCTKLDTTDIGSGLLPAVDNVHTFDTLLAINTAQGIFNDTSIVDRAENHALGIINNDPLFGGTTANVYMQLKPTFYPFYWGAPKDTLIGLDSVVLCLNYRGFWGDSTMPIHLNVMEVNDQVFRDSIYAGKTVNYHPAGLGALLGSTDVDVRRLADTVKYTNGRDYGVNQIRIKITNTAWAQALFASDSLPNHAFYSDTFFRVAYNGLAVLATTGNGLIYTNLADTLTKLEVHFRKKNNGKVDSIFTSLILNGSSVPSDIRPPSNTVNHIVRSRSGFPVSTPSSNDIYLQTSPGTYANLNIPGLSTLSNRLIHRAEIIVEQVPTDPLYDEIFSGPNFLYLDLKDTTIASNWKPIYYDLNPSIFYDPDFKVANDMPVDAYGEASIDFSYYGGFRREKTGPFGGAMKYYNFNITRYVQKMVTNHTPNYDMRLFAPFSIAYPQHAARPYIYNNNIANGRIRVGSGTNPNYKMRLRIVYSKL